MGKVKVFFSAAALLIAAMLLFYQGSAVTSSSGNFTVLPDTVHANWTSDVINITSNIAAGVFRIQNESTAIAPQYFSANMYQVEPPDPVYSNFSSDEMLVCLGAATGMKFLAQNASSLTFTNITDPLDPGSSTFYNVIPFQFCPPGYYLGKFNVTMNGSTENATVNMSVMIPISQQNTFNETSSKGGFKGTLATASSYHSYHFNTSIAGNVTGVTINLTWTDYGQDVDVFLFDSTGSLKGKSIERAGSDAIGYVQLPQASDIWELRVFGNISSPVNYTGWLFFTTINVTNATDASQGITSLDFGSLDPNATSQDINYTLNNTDGGAWAGVTEDKEIYRIDSWESVSQPASYELLVPSFAEKVRVDLEWADKSAKWNISLKDSGGNPAGNSSGKYYNANVSNATMEEFIIFTGPFNSTNDGLWNVTVANSTAISGDYNLTAYVWIPDSLLVSDYPASFTFNPAGTENSSKNVSVHLRIPETSVNNGTYGGFVEYGRPGEWKLRIPVHFSVRAGALLVNNTMEGFTTTLNDNIGFNRLGANALNLVFPVRNLGGYNITYANQTSDNKLNNTEAGKNTEYMAFSVNYPANPVPAGQSDTLNVTIFVNSSLANESGVYIGNITLNSTNPNLNASSYPFSSFTIVLKVNLTQNLAVNITSFSPSTVDAPQNATNITANVSVTLANTTTISLNNVMFTGDFNRIYIVEGNSSSIGIGKTFNLENKTGAGTGGAPCPAGESTCLIKSSLPAIGIGGLYYLYADIKFNTSVLGGSGVNLTGTGIAGSQIPVNNSAIYLLGSHDAGTVTEASSTTFTVQVRNYGPLAASNLQVRFNKGTTCSSLLTMTRYAAGTTCSGAASGTVSTTDWKIPTFAGYAPLCDLSWNLAAGSVDQDTNCEDMAVQVISGHPQYNNENITGIMLTISAIAGEEESGSQGQQTTCTSNATCASNQYCKNSACTTLTCPSGWAASNHKCAPSAGKLEITGYTENVNVLQGGSNATKVTVKNSGGYAYTAKLEATSSLSGFESAASPASYSLNSGNSGIFTVNFSVSPSAEVGYHTVTIKAYATENSSVYATKSVTLAVEPLEETKSAINRTSEDLRGLFVSITSLFNQMPPSAEANYTLANRTYYRLLNMFQDVENSIKAGNYVEANTLLKDLNASLTEFRQQVGQISGAGAGLLQIGDFGGMFTLVAILVVVIVIGGFLAYLLLPSKKAAGFHPALGFVPHEKKSLAGRIKGVFSGIKRPSMGRSQRTLGQFDPAIPAAKPVEPKPQEKKYMDGYHKLDQFPLEFDKDKNKFREKK